MATARVHHHHEDDIPNPQPIVITNSGISPQAYKIANQQPVTFSSTGPTVNIYFEPDAFGVTVFNNVTGVSPTNPQTIPPQTNDRTVNFNTDGSAVYPYAIQVGAGPMYVKVANSECTPENPVVPYGGTIRMISTDIQHYKVNWSVNAGNPFPGLTDVYTAGNPLTKTYTETLPVNANGFAFGFSVAPAPGPSLGMGGGNVIVKNS